MSELRDVLDGEAASHLIELKFGVGTDNHVIPAGFHRQERESDAARDLKHAAVARQMGESGLGEAGRYRENRRDTGEEVIKTGSVTVKGLVEALLTKGYVLSGHHSYGRPHPRNRDETTYTVVFRLRKPCIEPRVIEEAHKRYLDHLEDSVWGSLSVWNNPDGTITINLNGKVIAKDKAGQPVVAKRRLEVYQAGLQTKEMPKDDAQAGHKARTAEALAAADAATT